MLRRNDAKGFRGFDFVFGAIVGLYGNWLISFILKFKFEGSDFFIFISGILLTSALTFFVYTVHLVFVPKSKKLLRFSEIIHFIFIIILGAIERSTISETLIVIGFFLWVFVALIGDDLQNTTKLQLATGVNNVKEKIDETDLSTIIEQNKNILKKISGLENKILN